MPKGSVRFMSGSALDIHRAETYAVIEQLADDRMASFQELADEAFSLLLKKYGRTVGIKAQLKAS